MPEMFCCQSRMRIERNGVALVILEVVHGETGNDTEEARYIYESDRWKCPDCGRLIIAGLGSRPIMDRYRDGSEKFDNYLADLRDGKMMDMLGRAQPFVIVRE